MTELPAACDGPAPLGWRFKPSGPASVRHFIWTRLGSGMLETSEELPDILLITGKWLCEGGGKVNDRQ